MSDSVRGGVGIAAGARAWTRAGGFAGRFVGQIAVSLAATGCATLLVTYGSRYWREAEPPPRVAAASAIFGPERFGTVPPEAGHRPRAPFPIEFEAQFPLLSPPPPSALDRLVAASGAPQATVVAAASATAATVPSAPVARVAAATRRCGEACEGGSFAAVLPPRRPEALRLAGKPTPRAVVLAAAESASGVAAPGVIASMVPAPVASAAGDAGAGDERVRVLGVALPAFVPTPRSVVRTVASVGDTLSTTLGTLVDKVR